MHDPRRLPAASDADSRRDARTEELLVAGLDHYLGGRFEDAIHVWTRVLFLDRSHARARAYIERARTAIAERQRRADEMLQASSEWLTRGDAAEARRVLTEVMEAAGTDERAEALRLRIERVERAELAAGGRVVPARDVVAPGAARLRGRRSLSLVGLAIGAGVLALMVPVIRGWAGLASRPQEVAPARSAVARTVLSSSDVALVRARTLYARGRLAEALRALDRVTDEGSRVPANRLRTEIQQTLLATRASAGGREGSRRSSAGRE